MGEMYEWSTARITAGEDSRADWDTVTIGEMLIPLNEPDEYQEYTCIHLDRSSGRCTIYERRPMMCAEYPDYGRGDACIHCGFKNPITDIERAECTKEAA
jgi:Fe-S-cluster containining protein